MPLNLFEELKYKMNEELLYIASLILLSRKKWLKLFSRLLGEYIILQVRLRHIPVLISIQFIVWIKVIFSWEIFREFKNGNTPDMKRKINILEMPNPVTYKGELTICSWRCIWNWKIISSDFKSLHQVNHLNWFSW